MSTNKRGIELLLDPSLNKSTAFTEAEKEALEIVGLVPDVTETEDLQLSRVMMQLGHKTTDLERYIYSFFLIGGISRRGQMEIFARLSRGDHFKAAMGPSSFNRRLFGRGPNGFFAQAGRCSGRRTTRL